MPVRPPPFFVGDHPALDFLNSIASPKDVPVEWLRDGRDLVNWLELANMLTADVAERVRAAKDQRALNGVAGRARRFRDWLRAFVTRYMGKPLTVDAVKVLAPLNELLAGDTSYPIVKRAGREQAMGLRR